MRQTQSKPWTGTVPFNKITGNQLVYDGYYYGQDVEKVPNFKFEDTLTYESYARGRSACDFYFKRSSGSTVSFSVMQFERLIPHLVNGKVTGKFSFIKRGANYSCSLQEA